MGLLDDAIREHLELKRRRGADPDEVARQEDEALGDPRSGEFARPQGDPTAPEPEPHEPLADEPEPNAIDPGARAPVPYDAAAEPAPEHEEPHEPEPERAPRESAPTWLEDDERTDQPTAAFTPPGVEPEPEVVRPDDEPGPEEDVLEETPEFLQETPEHDRLWFEQKPPRDFDFDD
jgi:hypothetical protein